MANEIKGFYDRDDQKHDIVTSEQLDAVTSEQLDAAAAERVSAIKEAGIEVVLDGSNVSAVDCLVDNESVELDAFDNYTDKVRLVNVMIIGDDDKVILNRLGYYLSFSRMIAGYKQQRTQIIASGEYMISRTGVFGPLTPGWGDWRYLPSKTDVIASDNYLPVTSAAVYTALAGKVPYYNGQVIIKHKDDTIAYPVAGDDDVKNSLVALYKAIPDRTYVLCRVILDNSDYSGTPWDIVTVPALAYAEDGQLQDEWDVSILLANGVMFTAVQQGTIATSWSKRTSGFFS